MITVRRAESGDIPRILELLVQVNMVHHIGRPDLFKKTTKYTAEDLENLLSDDTHPVFVGMDEAGKVLGHGFCEVVEVCGNQLLCDDKSLYIDDICVDETARKQHVGRAIYEAIADYAKKIGCRRITLNVWECNPTARAFYDSLGMKPMKTTMEALL